MSRGPNYRTHDVSFGSNPPRPGSNFLHPDYTGQSVPVLMRRRDKSLQTHEVHSAQSRRGHQVILLRLISKHSSLSPDEPSWMLSGKAARTKRRNESLTRTR